MTARLGVLLLLAAGAGAGEGLGVRVNRALDRAAENLVSRQNEDGSWQADDAVHPLGRTALCTYALLHAGLPKDHAAVRKALAFLRLDDPRYHGKLEVRSVYETGCLLLLLHALGPGYDEHIHRLCAWLVDRFDDGAKLWGYPDGAPDLSNTQFAVFGLKVGALHGFDAPRDLWRALLKSVPRLQHRDGAFRYKADAVYRASMTHAALLVMRFAVDELGMKRPPGDVRRAMDRGHAWFAENLRVDRTPWGRGWHNGYYFYYMYGLARYGEVFGMKEIAGRDWYAEGAEELLARQEDNGSWGNLEDTCFAVLFLRKAVFTAPRERAVEGGAGGAEKRPERPRPGEGVPCLKEWLVAGSFRGAPHEDDLLFDDPIGVAKAAPAAGRRAGKDKWEAYASPDDRVDLLKACGPGDWSAFFAAVYLEPEADTDAVLWVASDDGCRVWLDGELVLDGHHHDGCDDDHYRVPLKLGAGRRLLLVMVENHGYGCWLRVRLSDAAGAPLAAVPATTRRR